jgi:hypothetical protein
MRGGAFSGTGQLARLQRLAALAHKKEQNALQFAELSNLVMLSRHFEPRKLCESEWPRLPVCVP